MFYIKQNDTSPAIQVTLKDSAGVVINVTNAAVVFNMRTKAGVVKVSRGVGAVVDGTGGVVKYAWVAADTDTVGVYEGEFEVTYADNAIETFPNKGMIPIKIEDDIA